MKKAVRELDAEVRVLSLPGSLSPWKLLQQSPHSLESCLLGRSSELLALFIGGKQWLGMVRAWLILPQVWVIH